ncbi:MAG: alpha/beta fold hydrolase, partial [candidate division NC10 bacterium]|nr:alpha/beta fold hydrolase [candidate division NC10 bacterium]
MLRASDHKALARLGRKVNVIDIKDETFDGTFPFAPHYHEVNGFAMHFVDEGSGEPVVLVHGDPTWGYLWRRFIPPLARRRRCIVPDHMGMGKSGVPEDPYPYRLHHHVANLESFLLHLDLHGMTLVLHDWGGPVGLGVATRHPERIKRLVLMNTWAFAPWPCGPFPRLLELIRSDRGERFVLEKDGYVEPALLGTTHHPEYLTPTVLGGYQAPFPTPASRRALLCWSRDIPVREADSSYGEMKRIEEGLARLAEKPTLLIWGMRDPVLSEDVLRRWQRIYPQAVTL